MLKPVCYHGESNRLGLVTNCGSRSFGRRWFLSSFVFPAQSPVMVGVAAPPRSGRRLFEAGRSLSRDRDQARLERRRHRAALQPRTRGGREARAVGLDVGRVRGGAQEERVVRGRVLEARVVAGGWAGGGQAQEARDAGLLRVEDVVAEGALGEDRVLPLDGGGGAAGGMGLEDLERGDDAGVGVGEQEAAVELQVLPVGGGELGGFEPGVLRDLGEGDAVLGGDDEDALQQLLELWGAAERLVLGLRDEVGDVDGFLAGEREAAGHHGVEDDAEAPHVDLGAAVGLALEDLGGGVVRGAAVGVEEGGVGELGGHAPVDDLDGGLVGGDEDVLVLQIAVDDVVLGVDEAEGGHELPEVAAGCVFVEGVAGDEVEECLPLQILHPDGEISWGFPRTIK